MSKAQIVRKSFNGGEITPELHYRSDLETYHNACKSLKNMTVTPWGAATRRPPTELLAKIDTATYGVPVKYLPFRFSLTETFHIIFTDGSGSASTDATTADFIVFDADGVLQTLDGASTKILTTVYDPADLGALHHIQVNDFIYMTCGGDYSVQALSRFFNEVEDANRWKVEEFTLEVGPFLEENTDTSKLVSIGGLGEWDSGVTYSQGDEVRSAASKVDINSASWQFWKTEPHSPGGGTNYYYRLKVTLDSSLGLSSGYSVELTGISLDGAYSVVSVSGNDVVVNRVWLVVEPSSWGAGDGPLPSITVVSGAEAYDANAAFGVFRSLIDSNLNNALPVSGSDSNWLQLDNASQTSFTLNATSDIFPVGCVGQAFRLLKEYESQLRARWEADTISQNYAIQGNITLTTEGGAWDGVLKLQESKDGGGNWETIGRIISVDGQFNGSIDREIFEPSSLIRVKLEDFNTPSSTYAEEACIWKLETTGNSYEYFRITSRVSGSEVTADPITPIEKMRSGSRWAFGAFSGWSGYPNTLTIHDERMVFGGTKRKPNTVWASRVNDWTNFLEGDTDVSPYTFTIKSDSFDTIRWMRSTRNLMIGTENSETTMGTRDDSAVISPTNIDVRTQTYFGSANIQAVVTADLVFFVQGQRRRVRSTQYDFGTDQYLSSEMSILAHHITKPGIKEMSFRRHPYSSIFFVLEDGRAVSFTYERDNKVKGWARFDITGGLIVSAAANYSEQGDIIAGIMRRNNDYFLETFGSLDYDTMYLDGQVSYKRNDFFEFASGNYAKALPFSTVDESTIVVLKNGELEPLGGSEKVDIYFDDVTFTPGQWVVFVREGHLGPHDVITVGFKYDFVIEPTDIIELGDHGAQKRISKLGLYLLDSGGCDISVNGEDCPFQEGDGLEPGGRLNGEYQVSVGGGTESAIRVKLSGDHHKPFNISAFGVFGQPSR